MKAFISAVEAYLFIRSCVVKAHNISTAVVDSTTHQPHLIEQTGIYMDGD